MKINPVTNQQFFSLQVHIIATGTEFGAVFHDTSGPTQMSTFVWKYTPSHCRYPYSCGSISVTELLLLFRHTLSTYHGSPQPSNIAPITGAILKIHAYDTGTRMLLTSFSLCWFIIMLFYKAEPATEFIIARGRTGIYIKKATMVNIKLFSQAGIRTIPECNSPIPNWSIQTR